MGAWVDEIRDMQRGDASDGVIQLALARQNEENAEAIAGVRDELKGIRRVLTGILVSIIIAMVGVPFAILWQVAWSAGN